MAEFTNYQRKMWGWLSYMTVCRYYIERDKQGNFTIKRIGRFGIFVYYLFWINTLSKLIYVLLTYHGWLLEIEFLGQMSMWVWFLIFIEMIQESLIWHGKYPLFEKFIANWKVQEDIYKKLGSPEGIQNKIVKNCRRLVIMHTLIVVIGCVAYMIQYFTAPKYASNTYAIIPWDNWPLRIIFAVHEIFFMWHAWCYAASVPVLCEVFALTYTHIIQEMTRVMKQLSRIGKLKESPVDSAVKKFLDSETGQKNIQNKTFIKDRKLDPKTVVLSTKYNILGLLEDYKNVMMATTAFNKWVGKIAAGSLLALYAQFVSDVFMMIQLLKEPETDVLAVFFYFEDALVGMLMSFPMLILMSRVYPASNEFLEAFKTYLQHDTPIRKYLLKYKKTLKIVSAKLGGHKVRGETVPKGIHGLINYYIAAALWKRQ